MLPDYARFHNCLLLDLGIGCRTKLWGSCGIGCRQSSRRVLIILWYPVMTNRQDEVRLVGLRDVVKVDASGIALLPVPEDMDEEAARMFLGPPVDSCQNSMGILCITCCQNFEWCEIIPIFEVRPKKSRKKVCAEKQWVGNAFWSLEWYPLASTFQHTETNGFIHVHQRLHTYGLCLKCDDHRSQHDAVGLRKLGPTPHKHKMLNGNWEGRW